MNYNFFFFLDIKFVERDKFVKVLKNGSILESSRSSKILKKKKKKGNGDYNFFLYKYLNWRNDSIMEMKRDRNFKQIIGRSDLGFILNDRAPRNT